MLEGLSEATLFGSTNAHPVISTAGSLADVAPSPAWSVTNAALAAGDTLVGAFWYTNSTDMIRAGTYIGRFYAVKSGTKTVTGKIALVYTDDNGATTNVIDTSAVSGAIGTSLASYRVTTHNDNNISGAGLYWGVLYYLTVSGSGTAPTVITYGGDPYDTHLETPGVGSLMGYVQTNDTTYTQTVALAASASQPGHAHAIADVTNAPAGFYPSNTATVTWSPIATNATTGLVTWQATGSAGASVVAGSGITVTTNGTEYTVAQSVTPTITAGTSITITTNSAQDWTIASTATGGGSQTPWTNNVDGGGYSLSGVNQLTLTNATLALTVPMGAAIRWYTDTTNYVDMKALSLGFMHFLSCSNGAIVTNIMQVNP